MKQCYFVETGVLLEPNHPEFYAYANVYDHNHSFYDENKFFMEKLEEAKDWIQEEVENGVDRTYGIVSEILIPDDADLENLDLDFASYDLNDVLYSVCKMEDRLSPIF